jgi:hypothetical protein
MADKLIALIEAAPIGVGAEVEKMDRMSRI